MAFIPVDEDAKLNLNMVAVEPTDPVLNTFMNERYKQLLENDAALKKTAGQGTRFIITVPANSTTTIQKGETVFTHTTESIVQDVLEYGDWTITTTDGRNTATRTVTVDDVMIYEVTLTYYGAKIKATYPEGADCICEKGDVVLTAQGTSGEFTFSIPEAGEWTVKATLGEKETSEVVNVTEEIEYTVELKFIPKARPFGEISDDDLVAIVEASNRGEIDIYEYTGWDVGDERKMTLSAHGGIEDSETHAEQEVTWVILNKGGYSYVDGAPIAYVLGLKNCLLEKGKMNTLDTTEGGWKDTARRSWCNNEFYNAIPSNLRPIFKKYKRTVSKGGVTTSIQSTGLNEVEDYFGFPTMIEAMGKWSTASGAMARDEADYYGATSQYEWYRFAGNLPKWLGDSKVSSATWWTCSVGQWSSPIYFAIGSSGTNGRANPASLEALAPVGCIATKYIRGTIRVSYPDDATSCTLTKGDTVLTATANPFSFRNLAGGEWEIKIQKAGVTSTKKVLIHTNGQEEDIKMVCTASWSEGSDEVIRAMIEASNKGDLDLSDYWSVGDERVIHLNAMSAMAPLTDTHAEQDTTWVLMNKGGKICSDGTVGAFVVGIKTYLDEDGSMNDVRANAGGWKDCKRRLWCNTVFKDSVPESIRGIFKQHRNINSNGGTSANVVSTGTNITDDYFFLPAEMEVFGAKTYSATDEASQLGTGSQFEYYKALKGAKGTIWALRSAATGTQGNYPFYYCSAGSGTSPTMILAEESYKLAPHGVIGTLKIDATLHIKFEPGATCKVEGVGETFIAPDSSGTWDLKIDRGGVYTVTVTGTFTKTKQISVVENGDMDVNLVYSIMTVKINLADSNPETCCTYEDDAVSMTPGSNDWDKFFGEYPVMLLNGVEGKKLDPNDFTKHEDGTNADITSGAEGDVMICFPRRGIKITKEGNIITVSMTDLSDDSRFSYYAHTRGNSRKEKLYIGAYNGYVVSNKLRSLSGVAPYTSNKTTFRTLANANGSGYDMLAFYPYLFLQAMYILKYKNLNSQVAVGMGYTSGSAMNSGQANKKGMDYGETTGNEAMKLFGIEHLWGNIACFIDGIYFSSSNHILTATNNFNDTSSGYSDYGTFSPVTTSFYLVNVQGSTELGFIFSSRAAGAGSSTTYFCDQGYLYQSSYNSTALVVSSAGDYGHGLGIFAHYSQKYDYTGPNARLMYL